VDQHVAVDQRSQRRIGLLRPFRNRDFAVLWTGMTVSMIGDGVYLVAIAWQVIDLSRSPAALAAVGVAWSLPQALFVLGSGVLSDRLDRRRVMIAGDAIRLAAIGAIGALSLSGRITMPLLLALVVVYGSGQALFQPSFQAIVPMIVPTSLLVEANAVGQFVRPFAMTLVGPLVGGVLIRLGGVGSAFLVDAATFAFSAAMILSLRARPAPREADEVSSAWRDLVGGLRYVREQRWLLIAMFGGTISLLCTWGPWEALVPYVVRRELGGGPLALGLVFGAGGVGAVTAAIVVGQRGRVPRRAITALYLAWALGMLLTAGFGLVSHVWQAMIVAVFAEASITVLIVIWYTLVQALVPPELLGRVMSFDWMLAVAGVPASFAIVGPTAAAIGVDATLVVAGILGGAVTLAVMFVPGARAPERDGSIERLRDEAARESLRV
jgi:MFS family permease